MEPVSMIVGAGLVGVAKLYAWWAVRTERKRVADQKLLPSPKPQVPEYHIESDGTRVRVVESRFWLGPGK